MVKDHDGRRPVEEKVFALPSAAHIHLRQWADEMLVALSSTGGSGSRSSGEMPRPDTAMLPSGHTVMQ